MATNTVIMEENATSSYYKDYGYLGSNSWFLTPKNYLKTVFEIEYN
jgi:hypothetical protein